MNKQERLLTYVARDKTTGCWLWRGQVSNTGHGRIKMANKDGQLIMQSAHRASYQAFTGDLPDNKRVLQTCGNPLCINPGHLKLDDL
jgi:hypothetical protein